VSEVTPRRLVEDDAAWDAFVAESAMPSYLQATAWAAIKQPNGWSSMRVAAAGPAGPVGAQLLVRRAPGIPWGLGYAPRGPVSASPLDADAVRAFTDRVRAAARSRRLAAVRMEPEAPRGEGLEEALTANGWRPVPSVQQDATRIVDISVPEEEVWAQFHRKTRQSITKSERQGIRTVVDEDGSRVGDFYRIHVDSMERQGIMPRSEETFHEMWEHLAPRRMAHILFAESEETGEAVATLFLMSCGPRVMDVYGGTTAAGNATRANYLLKWDAIKRCRAWGYREYDLWGIPRAGIAQFKSGFGGREVYYVGGWELPVGRVGPTVLSGVQAAREWYRRLRGVRQLEHESGA